MIRRHPSLWRDRRGVAAVEFALIAPLLVGLYLGAIELTMALSAQRRLGHMAAAISDMATQSGTLTDAQLADIMQAGSLMAHPLPISVLGKRVSSISANASGVITVDWTKTTPEYDDPRPPEVPVGFLQPDESAIVTDITYDYQPVFGLIFPNNLRFTRHAYLRPRLSDKVDCTGCT